MIKNAFGKEEMNEARPLNWTPLIYIFELLSNGYKKTNEGALGNQEPKQTQYPLLRTGAWKQILQSSRNENSSNIIFSFPPKLKRWIHAGAHGLLIHVKTITFFNRQERSGLFFSSLCLTIWNGTFITVKRTFYLIYLYS